MSQIQKQVRRASANIMKLREVLPEQKCANAYFKLIQSRNKGKTLEEIRDICKEELQHLILLASDNHNSFREYFNIVLRHIDFAYNTIKLEEKS